MPLTSLDEIPLSWSKRFGLAVSPLFEEREIADHTRHHVFLDGGHGTFALSIGDQSLEHRNQGAGWAWSSDIAHHVTVTDSKVAVVRWDNSSDATVLTRASVEKNLDEFYKFISADRIQSTRTVVFHLLGLFRRIRSLTAEARISDARASEIFLLSLARLLYPDEGFRALSDWGIGDDVSDLYDRVNQGGMESALNEITRSVAAFGALQLYPALAIRHAGGMLFQEAHFELIRSPARDFFDYIGFPEVSEIGRGGAHFTPPALARSLVEQTINQISDLGTRATLTICDPACGSGVFLHEVLRALRRRRFEGSLVLVGRDISPIAVSMAKFVLQCAIRDWKPRGCIRLQLDTHDSLEDGALPASDVVLMNPPFISWSSQSDKQRSQLISIVGRAASSRGDLSMAFIARGLESLNSGGALGVVFPSSLLSQESAGNWRQKISDEYQIKFLSSMGDYGLFTNALVQVACGVFTKDQSPSEATALVAGNDSYATGDALRTLRKLDSLPPAIPVGDEQWSIFGLPIRQLQVRNTWRLRPPTADAALTKLEEFLPRLEQLFDVRQGVQTGCNPALLLEADEWMRLPKRERVYFRKATMSDSIKNGEVIKPYYLFFPYDENVTALFASEAELRRAVPDFYQRYLSPSKKRLSERACIKRSGRRDWWGLMEPRSTWSGLTSPRLISKYFSGEGGFVADNRAEYLPSTGFVWLPKAALKESKIKGFPLASILSAYAAIFNSATFTKLLQYYAPHVSGGQFDLSPRYVKNVPVPELMSLITDPVRGQDIRALAETRENVGVLAASELRETIVADIYGPKIVAAL